MPPPIPLEPPGRPPLLDLDLVPDAEVESIADPFPVSHEGRLYVLAEVLGRRSGVVFKKIGVFAVDDDLRRAAWIGEACPGDDGLCSFPSVIRDGARFLMTPEVFVPMQGGGAAIRQVIQVWETGTDAFPFGWRKIVEGIVPGCAAPSDKVLLRHGEEWWLFCSDNAMQRLLAYRSSDLRRWRPHPANPLSRAPSPWRLGGAPLDAGGRLALPLQHATEEASYGGGVTLLRIERFDADRFEGRLDPEPVLRSDPRVPWRSRGAHHLALADHAGSVVLATDGCDGRSWRGTLFPLPGTAGLGAWR
jgi:hypothetical protein